MFPKSFNGKENITAVDYINHQTLLEKAASEIMPYDPNVCTYTYGPIRQILFACLTCYRNNPSREMNGICYSCSIQCHHDHELVELFTKRNFACDCGTTRIPTNGCCKLRYAPLQKPTNRTSDNDNAAAAGSVVDLTAITAPRRSTLKEVWKEIAPDDIASTSNVYSQNFEGLFCSCGKQYNPAVETGNMVQCNFGGACNEEWYHEECILGLKPGMVDRERKRVAVDKKFMFRRKFGDGVNVLDILPEAEDEAVNNSEITKEFIGTEPGLDKQDKNDDNDDDEGPLPLEGFPDYEQFEGFICWRCVNQHKTFFNKLLKVHQVCLDPVYHVGAAASLQDRLEKIEVSLDSESPPMKRVKLEQDGKATTVKNYLEYSIFLKDDYQDSLKQLFIDKNSPSVEKCKLSDYGAIRQFLLDHQCLWDDEPIYEPPEDEDLKSESGSSIFELGSKVLEQLPREQAIEGAQAYEMIKNKLKEFLKPFAEKGEVVTEDKIRTFFDGMHEKLEE
ncbi:hypothetical protein DASC09_010370 [Saccharomycopsis crataegensis]|uniref:UBR-type domain-containing protein n=1 Tax=Saccharomycopsis crataegensis TaxID=43959 RepID=A0AAV5QGG0_9ASCO|nr:hypothetical protein DASC09_010370 [Saccharomycopsis crataegensis]